MTFYFNIVHTSIVAHNSDKQNNENDTGHHQNTSKNSNSDVQGIIISFCITKRPYYVNLSLAILPSMLFPLPEPVLVELVVIIVLGSPHLAISVNKLNVTVIINELAGINCIA